MPCSETFRYLAEEIAEYTAESKYKLTFIQNQNSFALSDPVTDLNFDQTLLCVKGGEAAKSYTRFLTIDSPERPVTYLSDDVGLDAIAFVPQKDVTFLGFSVYPVVSSQDDFTVHYSI